MKTQKTKRKKKKNRKRKQKKKQRTKKEEKKEEKEEKGEEKETEKEKEAEKETEKKDEGAEKPEKTDEEKKPFKLKVPKVPAFLRSKSKEREKQKDKTDEEPKEGEEKADEGEKESVEPEEKGKDAKTKVKEALDNIHMPKMPKLHKPAFLKKKKEGEAGGDAPAEGKEDEGEKENKEETKEEKEETKEEKEEGKEEKEETKDEKEESTEEKKEEKSKETDEEKKPGFLDNLKSIGSHVQLPSFLSKKESKVKDVEAGGDKEEESKELLEKKEGEEDEKKEGEEETEKELEPEEKAEKAEEKETVPAVKKDEGPSKATAFLDSLRNVASQVPSIFKGQKDKKAKSDKDADVEAGEKEELLEAVEGEIVEKKEGDLEEVKVVVPSDEDEKKDAEKPESSPCSIPKYLNQLKEGRNVCQQKYNALERPHQLGILATLAGLLLLLFILIIVAICSPSQWTNYARMSEDGKYVVTDTTCGPVQGLVEGHDQFSFKRIPYAIQVIKADRWTHSSPMTKLEDCHTGTLKAHNHDDTGSCWKKYPKSDSDGAENCLTLDIYTSSVVYTDLKPVVVYIDGDDLSQDVEAGLQPSASLASKTNTVFVSVNYRRGVLGFLSLKSLSDRSSTKSSGNYGLGDIVSALKWIKRNINHFGGHPGQVTILARGSGATLVTALTASDLSKDLFKQVWVTNGAGAFENKTLTQANTENKAILEALNCGSDEVPCLIDATPEDITNAVPFIWDDTKQPELPQVGEKEHSWIVLDKHFFVKHPLDYWQENKFENKISIVFGSTAQGEVIDDSQDFIDWENDDTYAAHVEGKLGSFNETIPGQAIELYNVTDNWQSYASMVSDIRTVCPLQKLAQYVSQNFVSKVYSYVATQKRTDALGGIADKTIDIAAILGSYETENEDELKFIANMNDMFFTFVKTGNLPKGNHDLAHGMYIVDSDITTEDNYQNCDFWEKAQKIVPTYAALD